MMERSGWTVWREGAVVKASSDRDKGENSEKIRPVRRPYKVKDRVKDVRQGDRQTHLHQRS